MAHVGYVCEPTPWHTLSQTQLDAFDDITLAPAGKGDSGFLVLSMLAHFAEQFSIVVEGLHWGMNYGFDQVRFLTPVRPGCQIRARAHIVAITEKRPDQYLIDYDVLVELRGEDEPALSARWRALIFL